MFLFSSICSSTEMQPCAQLTGQFFHQIKFIFPSSITACRQLTLFDLLPKLLIPLYFTYRIGWSNTKWANTCWVNLNGDHAQSELGLISPGLHWLFPNSSIRLKCGFRHCWPWPIAGGIELTYWYNRGSPELVWVLFKRPHSACCY